MIDLTSYDYIRAALFVRLDINEYRTTSTASYTATTLRFSDHNQNFTINGENYIPLGNLLSVTSSLSELRPSSNTVTVAITGIPNSSISEIIHSKIKGAPVAIYRAYFNGSDTQVGNTEGRYIGSISNYSLDEDYDPITKEATNTILLECLSNVDVLSNKVAGRTTSSQSMKKFYSNDTSFDNVTALSGTTFNFGADK